MEDFSPIVNYVKRYISLTAEEEAYYVSLLRIKKIRKKQFIVQPDFVCNHRTYIVKGALRSYLIDANGQDHTVAFGIDDWWISDFNSYFFRQPATLFVEALEASTIIQISYDDEQKLLDTHPKFEKFYRILAQVGYAYLQRRILVDISLDATGRYENFLLKYPLVAARVPQYALASFLGISHELLSKIRNKRVKKS
ncbi:Crp/Fnr family transcriptional regulator [Mucilaginibacter sp. CAU 1740]|uniref:Crp/Fnr family transcriptional regulator n=1 Tax=Mucilaginibacter sp. CAU 1740 TaxID=3140365 RepID=UPI00325B30B5